MGAREANEAVAQIFPLQEEEDDEDDDDSGGRQRLEQRADDRLQDLERRRVGLMDLDRDGGRLGAARAAAAGTATGARVAAAGVERVISSLSRFSMAEARPTTPPPVAEPRREWIFSATLVWYCGRFSARWASWLPMTDPRLKIRTKASRTAAMTDGTRPTCQRRRNMTRGPRAKLSSRARAKGTKTSRAK